MALGRPLERGPGERATATAAVVTALWPVRQSLAVAGGNLLCAADLLGVTQTILGGLLLKHAIGAAQFGRDAIAVRDKPAAEPLPDPTREPK